VFLGHSGGLDTDGNELPRLVYVSREKRPGFQHHKKAGAMNALVWFSFPSIHFSTTLVICLYLANSVLFADPRICCVDKWCLPPQCGL
jgi:hypothetical protein